MLDLNNSQQIQAQFFSVLVNPKIPISGKFKRSRASPTKIKILYQLFQLHKNFKNRNWTQIFQGKTAICQSAKVGRKHFSEFINSEDYRIFGKVKHRYGTTSIYELNGWTIRMFEFFEKTGMMRGFRNNFESWQKTFSKRLEKWVIPNLENGLTIQDLMKGLSTKKSLKGYDPKPLKGYGIKPYGVPSIKPIQGKTNTVATTLPSFLIKELEKSYEVLDKIGIPEADKCHFVLKTERSLLLQSSQTLFNRLNLGWNPQSRVRSLQALINENRGKRIENRGYCRTPQ